MSKSRSPKLKVNTFIEPSVQNFDNSTINSKNFFNKKKFAIISLCIIISIILIVLSIIYALKINFSDFFTNVHNAITTNHLVALWLILLLLFIPYKLYVQITIYVTRLRRLGIKTSFWESILYTLTISFLTTISPGNLLVDPYSAFWLRTQHVEPYKCGAITICTMLIWHTIQILITIPSYVIVCMSYNDFVKSNVTSAKLIFWFVSTGFIVDLITLSILAILGTSRHIHIWISLLWNRIKKIFHFRYLPKHHVIYLYMNQELLKKEFRKQFMDWKISIYCVIVLAIHEIFLYFTAAFALKFSLPKDVDVSILGVFNAANVAITANKFIPIPGGEYTSQQFLSIFCQVLGKVKLDDKKEIEHYVNNSVLIWRFVTTYLLSIIGLCGFIVYLTHYISQVRKFRKLIKTKRILEKKLEIMPFNSQGISKPWKKK
ncbi:MAG: hypothetical protein J6Y96_01660 [Mycoplasma sp.]|nr:hypothetical protein [Mycoplasma sp.]